MEMDSNLSWVDLVESAAESCRAMARQKLGAAGSLSLDGWCELTLEAAIRTAPRRDAALFKVLLTRPDMLRRPVSEPVQTIAEAINLLATDMLRDELIARLGSLRRELGAAARYGHAAPAPGAPIPPPPLASWGAYLPRLREWFEARMRQDAAAGELPVFAAEPAAVAEYIGRLVELVIPAELADLAALVGSSAELAGRLPPPTQTFADCATQLLERALEENFADWFRDSVETEPGLAPRTD